MKAPMPIATATPQITSIASPPLESFAIQASSTPPKQKAECKESSRLVTNLFQKMGRMATMRPSLEGTRMRSIQHAQKGNAGAGDKFL
jgi:hypothetical protein